MKVDLLAKAISHRRATSLARLSVWDKNLKCLKHAKNHSTRTIELFCAKNCFKKNKNSRNKTSWKNRPSCKSPSSCKGYSLCKMVSLFYKFKMPKRCENHSTRTLDLLCAKNRSKKHPHNIREMKQF